MACTNCAEACRRADGVCGRCARSLRLGRTPQRPWRLDLTGRVFGARTARECVPPPAGRTRHATYWRCDCACDAPRCRGSVVVMAAHLVLGMARSCRVGRPPDPELAAALALGLSRATIAARLARRWPRHLALTTPPLPVGRPRRERAA